MLLSVPKIVKLAGVEREAKRIARDEPALP
jgi:hypothetical protein